MEECKQCKRPLPVDYKFDLCPACREENLFADVRDYIRANEVNEYMVAEHFDIPIRQVRKWIREGRIEYTELGTQIVGAKCQRCGKPVTFGTLCTDCMRLMNYKDKQITLAAPRADSNAEKMRFLDNE